MITFSNRSMPALRQVYRNRKNSMRVRQLAWLEYVARFYNSNNRSSDVVLGCRYYPAHANTPGCAIGADIPKRLAKRYDKFSDNAIGYMITYRSDVAGEIPEWMRDFISSNFLSAVQRFHDNEGNWTETGLSEAGEGSYERLVIHFTSNN